jgi:hypothetical protein
VLSLPPHPGAALPLSSIDGDAQVDKDLTLLLSFPFANHSPVMVPKPRLMTVSLTLSVEASASNGQGAAERGGGVFPSSISYSLLGKDAGSVFCVFSFGEEKFVAP